MLTAKQCAVELKINDTLFELVCKVCQCDAQQAFTNFGGRNQFYNETVQTKDIDQLLYEAQSYEQNQYKIFLAKKQQASSQIQNQSQGGNSQVQTNFAQIDQTSMYNQLLNLQPQTQQQQSKIQNTQ